MSYEKSGDEIEDDVAAEGVELDDATIDAQEPAGIVEDAQSLNVNLKAKDKGNEHLLEVRRAIEDHLDRTKLQKDLDYLFDEKFADQDDE